MTYTDHLTLLKNKYFIGRLKKKNNYTKQQNLYLS